MTVVRVLILRNAEMKCEKNLLTKFVFINIFCYFLCFLIMFILNIFFLSIKKLQVICEINYIHKLHHFAMHANDLPTSAHLWNNMPPLI